MNDEQIEAVFINADITCKLCEINSVESSRNTSIDEHGNFVINVNSINPFNKVVSNLIFKL